MQAWGWGGEAWEKQAAKAGGFISLALCMELIGLLKVCGKERKIAFEYRK